MAHRRHIGLVCASLLFLAPAAYHGAPVPPDAVASASPDDPPVTASAQPVARTPVVAAPGVAATVGRGLGHEVPVTDRAPSSVPQVVLDAYRFAAAVAPAACHLEVSLLAAIGQVESGNLAGYLLDARHRASPPVLGPILDGSPGRAAIRDTDGGEIDGSRRWDRAVGPMQFIPSSWRLAAVDLDGDGVRDPQDIEDAAGAAMVYLCAAGRDLDTPAGLREAVLAYNHSTRYLRLVLAWKHAYDVHGFGLLTLPLPDLVAVRVGPVIGPPDVTGPDPQAASGTTLTRADSTPRPTPQPAAPSQSAAPVSSSPSPPVSPGPSPPEPSPPGQSPTGPPAPTASPAPASPTPASPTPASPTPASPTPATPATPTDTPDDRTPGCADPTPTAPVPSPSPATTDPADPGDPAPSPGPAAPEGSAGTTPTPTATPTPSALPCPTTGDAKHPRPGASVSHATGTS